jgi:hypothetical protein
MSAFSLSGASLAVFGLASIVACSSGSSPAGSEEAGPACDPCDDGGSSIQVGAGNDSNPYGVAYPAPAGGYGHTPRTGSTPGSIIENFKFLGYLNGDSTKPLTTISLADYYDPCVKTYKLIHLSVAAVWCVPCNDETSDLVAGNSALVAEGVVLLQALDEGAVQGTPATVSDLNYWINEHESNFTEMLDPGLHNFGGFFNAGAIPWNADVDPRTMELLDSSDGYSGSAQGEVVQGLSDIGKAPLVPIDPAANCQ